MRSWHVVHFRERLFFTRRPKLNSTRHTSVLPCYFSISFINVNRSGCCFPTIVLNRLCQPSLMLFVLWELAITASNWSHVLGSYRGWTARLHKFLPYTQRVGKLAVEKTVGQKEESGKKCREKNCRGINLSGFCSRGKPTESARIGSKQEYASALLIKYEFFYACRALRDHIEPYIV